ncbi:hypothetical protein [Butyrivibrio proteoclasticus]|uniref:hypothetical protein n=1 Tax=Butyrivibrio proteoclasticus TaxID=43305 RepID=UPI000B04AE85|nr:hypothetical protein [Butyrivibrio proteoclasticus]
MTFFEKTFGSIIDKEKNSADTDLLLEQTGSKERKPKAEISEENTIILTERDRIWEGMK